MASTLERLAHWYKSNCDGDWEYSFGLTIDTLDNPGWSITVDLDDTPLGDRPFEVVERLRALHGLDAMLEGRCKASRGVRPGEAWKMR
jgi:hypothetical protein